MDKARELLNLGVIKSFTQSRVLGGSYETTKHLLSLPPGASFTLNSASPSTTITGTAAQSVNSIPTESTGSSQQIRHLLSMDGQAVVPSSMKHRASPSNTDTSSKPALAKQNSSPSPGQSLIKKVKVSTASSISRQLLTSTDVSGSKTISLVLGATKPGDGPVIRMATSQASGGNISQVVNILPDGTPIQTTPRTAIQPQVVATTSQDECKSTSAGHADNLVQMSHSSKTADQDQTSKDVVTRDIQVDDSTCNSSTGNEPVCDDQ